MRSSDLVEVVLDSVVVTGSTFTDVPGYATEVAAGGIYVVRFDFRASGTTVPTYALTTPAGSSGHFGGAALGSVFSNSDYMTQLSGVLTAGGTGVIQLQARAPSSSFTIHGPGAVQVREILT